MKRGASGSLPTLADNLRGLDLFAPAANRREAHKAILYEAAHLRMAVLAAIRAAPDGLTADEAAAAVGESVLAVRPRCTELQQDGAILPTRARRVNASGRTATVWVAA